MKTSPSNRRNTVLLIATLSLSGLAAGAADILLYDASLGTLPTAQGFTDGSTPGGSSPTVSGGELHQPGNATLGGYQFWYAYATNPPFAFSTNTYTVEMTLRVLYAADFPPAVDPDNTGRGFQFSVIDAAGYQFTINIGTNSVTLGGNCAFTNIAFNGADGFHTYRVRFSTNTVTLFLDDTLFASTPITGAPIHPDQYANYLYFGDGSGWTTSDVLIRRFRYACECAPTPGLLLSIYPAVELVFSTETNKTYQLQYVAEVGMTNWMNFGAPIVGTGTNVSTFDSTRTSPGRFYRVQIIE